MMIPSKIKNNGFTAFLILLVVIIGVLSYQNAKDYSELKAVFELDKEELEQELTSIIKDYKQASFKKNEYSLRLKDELEKVVQLRDSVKNLKEADYRFIRYYRKRTKILIEENHKLFEKINYLSSINDELLSKNDSVNQALLFKEHQNTKLFSINNQLNKERKVLKEKVAIAEVIEISTIKAEALKKRKNGKYTSTTRSEKVNAFKIEFDLLENKVASPGPKEVHIQITDNNNNVVAPIKDDCAHNNKKTPCSDVLIADYNNRQLSMVSFVNINNKINAGVYHINTFVNGINVGNNSLALK
ncbi:hypothetical protein [Tenacibaculum aestuarii]|uniref:hypothetical protein n=1 Tax=Tenacibaculum aestuarii TaxID=362781 RepID=UPI0038936C5D